eukprot:SAG11_NODE_1324_length_5199_cov_5.524902_2_plen_70_part_00
MIDNHESVRSISFNTETDPAWRERGAKAGSGAVQQPGCQTIRLLSCRRADPGCHPHAHSLSLADHMQAV